jgi:hypothetical protein
MPLSRDESNYDLPPLPLNLPKNWDTVVLNDNFDNGVNGWHTQNADSFPPSLSDHSMSRSRHSLKLGTGKGGASVLGGTTSIYKRTTGMFTDGYMLFLAWMAFRGSAEHASPGSITLSMDHQKYDDTGRSFPKLILRRVLTVGGVANTFAPRWSLNNDAIPAQTVPYTDIGSGVSQYPASAGVGDVPGWNLNHGNFFLAALVMSMNDADTPVAGVGVGRYHRAYLGDQVHDLTALLTSNDGTKPGNGAQNPQTDISSGGPNPTSSFSGGINFGASISNRGDVGDGPAALFLGHAFAAHYPVGTVFPTGSMSTPGS